MTEEWLNRARAAAYAASRSTQSGVGRYADTAPRPQRTAPPTRANARYAYEQAQRERAAPPRGEAYAMPRNQFAEAGQMGLEMTGLPSVRRSAAAFADGRPREGFEEGAMAAVSLGTLGLGGRSTAPGGALRPQRVAIPDAPPQPITPPPRQVGRASDGSVLPVRPREPFRQSMVGGSDDLAQAARPGALRPAPDGSPSGVTAYRGQTSAANPAGDVTWWSADPETANTYAMGSQGYVRKENISTEGFFDFDAQGAFFDGIPISRVPQQLRPYVETRETAAGSVASTESVADAARRAGYNGVSIRNVRDGQNGWSETPTTVYSVFRRPPAPDGSPSGNAYVEDLRSQGFDVDTPLYHGTRAAVEGNLGDIRASEGVWLTPERELASGYAERWNPMRFPEGGAVYPVYARLRNPLRFDARGEAPYGIGRATQSVIDRWLNDTSARLSYHGHDWLSELIRRDPPSRDEIIAAAKRDGYDGIIFENIEDTAGYLPYPRTSLQTQTLVFDPQNIAPRFGASQRRASAGSPSAGGNGFDLMGESPEAFALRRELNRQDVTLPGQTRPVSGRGPRGEPYMIDLPRQRIPLSELPRINSRDGLDQDLLAQYGAMDTPAPPIMVVREGGRWRILDGHHRLVTARSRQSADIDAYDATHLFDRPGQ